MYFSYLRRHNIFSNGFNQFSSIRVIITSIKNYLIDKIVYIEHTVRRNEQSASTPSDY